MVLATAVKAPVEGGIVLLQQDGAVLPINHAILLVPLRNVEKLELVVRLHQRNRLDELVEVLLENRVLEAVDEGGEEGDVFCEGADGGWADSLDTGV